MSGELELQVSFDWQEIERVNKSAGDFLREQNLSEESVIRYTMVICELVENAIKYGSCGASGEFINVNASLNDITFTAQVTNPLDKSSLPYIHELDRTIQWIRGFQDPFEAYLERMKAISQEPLEKNKSGLGIARIAHEGRASIDFFIKDNSMINVSAVAIID
ncbi:MAG: hypothetical protein HZC28_12850 [Spirochaetes bacterium]|nr:hypothetical protein [Spirochaetota bacterium]